ncbi:hypothetical protein SDC9_159873 [bioreactor metagenome]|uniref:Uncharacterized protein n=1 Tax=bioreactor metagenome TaxID=1076179 RepID=A0A645FDT3_9ZZZZ
MQAGGFQLVIAHDDAVVLQILVQLVEVLQIAVFAVRQRVHAVGDGPVGHGGQPGVVVGAVHAVACDGLGQIRVLVPGHVVGGIGDAGLIKQGLVIEQHPEVGAEGQGVVSAVGDAFVALVHAGVLAHVIGAGGDAVVQVQDEAFPGPVLHIAELFDGHQVNGFSAGEHGGRLDVVVLAGQVHPFKGHIRIGGFKARLDGIVVGGLFQIPAGSLQDDLVLSHRGREDTQQHHSRQQQGNPFLHDFILLDSIFKAIMLPITFPSHHNTELIRPPCLALWFGL